MSASINGTTGVTYPDGSTQATAATSGLVNKIINGRMEIDQRNAGASVTGNNQVYSVDRWKSIAYQASKFTMQQNAGAVTPPAGFKKYLGITSSSAYTVGTGETFSITQVIEGYNIADLGWGAAGASAITLSFWVRSSLTGTFGGALWNSDATRSYPFSYTISVANTWEQKTITIAGDTSGTWASDNTAGINVNFGLGVGASSSGTAGSWSSTFYTSSTGATSVVGTNGATFYITGVDLRKGTVAPTTYSQDWRPYGLELALCQRYYEKSYDSSVAPGSVVSVCGVAAVGNFAGQESVVIRYKVEKRAATTFVTYDRNGNAGKVVSYTSGGVSSSVTPSGTYASTSSGIGVYYNTTDVTIEFNYTASAEL